MKNMKFSLYLNDYETEKLFSYLRWLFVFIASILFYVPPFSLNLSTNKAIFPYLLVTGVLYMLIAQIALLKAREDKKTLHIVLKVGILFDYIALIWLMALSDGIHSPLYPISILFVMHSTIYWRTKGALISLSAFSLSYIGMGMITENLSQFHHAFTLFFNLFFLWIIGLFGALIMLRERSHFVQKEAYHHLVHRDYLSGLFNHRSFQEKFRRKLESNNHFFLLLGDIDDFKKVNDEYGHLIGDEVIKSVGEILLALTEEYDAEPYRYGGEEFALLMPKMTEETLKQFLSDLYLRIKNVNTASISMSFGLACSNESNEPEKLISLADQRLYIAKKSGKKRVYLSSDEVFIPECERVDKKALYS
ncbi:GGDEF domain-containing protein [Rossellomorea aquimaris]|uniref:GGDEF domain-containing protein n=1 Tax=Rossellomorea aquimaris TaxID=189382 RepID=UPI0007D07119|nr:GGDEF domain-containing protein [Rossellomorea aquimaris]